MKKICLILLLIQQVVIGQEMKINPEKKEIQEPNDPAKSELSEATLKLNIESSLGAAATDIKFTVSINKEKTTYKGDLSLNPAVSSDYPATKAVTLTLKTSKTDKNEQIVLDLKYMYKESGVQKDAETQTSIDVINTYPALAEIPKNRLPWDEPREADVFIGTNFDFIDKKVKTSDWYGGIRLFLPDITRIGFGKNRRKIYPRIGMMAGLYQSKSFSKISFPSLNGNAQELTGIYERIVQDRYLSSPTGTREFKIERDSVRFSNLNTIRNLGFYGGFTYLLNKPDVKINNSLFRIYAGTHFEVIRRNVSPENNVFDTLNRAFESRLDTTRGGNPNYTPYPVLNTTIYTDAYFGITFPIQYRWKDMMNVRLVPTFGYSTNQYIISHDAIATPKSLVKQKWFYLVQFDMLIKAGGININLGGEIRGYFPRNVPIATAYMGTSFSIEKVIDFIAK